jgi:hypothetical protein
LHWRLAFDVQIEPVHQQPPGIERWRFELVSSVVGGWLSYAYVQYICGRSSQSAAVLSMVFGQQLLAPLIAVVSVDAPRKQFFAARHAAVLPEVGISWHNGARHLCVISSNMQPAMVQSATEFSVGIHGQCVK